LGDYRAELVSVHDPDEYLAAAKDGLEQAQRYQDILEAYRALNELKRDGQVKGDWCRFERLADHKKNNSGCKAGLGNDSQQHDNSQSPGMNWWNLCRNLKSRERL
jgi:hypothetical protein